LGNRKDALEKGLKTYFSDVPCKHCGGTEKYVCNYTCSNCQLKKLGDDSLMQPYRTVEKQRNKLRKWRSNNYEKYQQQWLDPSKTHLRNAKSAKRRADKKEQTPDTADFDLIREVYHRCKVISEETGIPHEVDHIIPIAKGGLHHQDNLQIITRHENRMKGARLDESGPNY
jgi:5-methylcytosine-specific restriction endonuclease McrA